MVKCSITERSIAFDGQNFFVSSIKFDWVRLPNVRLTTPGIVHGEDYTNEAANGFRRDRFVSTFLTEITAGINFLRYVGRYCTVM